MKRLWLLVFVLGCSSGDGSVDVAGRFGAVVLNPSGNAPLAASVVYRPAGDEAVVVTVAGRDGVDLTARLAVSGAAEEVEIPILGLYADTENVVSLAVQDAAGGLLGEHIVTIATAPLPAGLPEIVVEGEHEPGQFTFFGWLLEPIDRPEGVAVMVDAWGRVRWVSDFAIPDLHPLEIWDGTIYCGDLDEALLRYDFLGHELLNLDLSAFGYERVHHDIVQRENGHLLLTVDRSGADYIEDRVIEVDPERGQLRARWNLADVLPDLADLFYDLPVTGLDEPGVSNDPVHINAVAYDEADGTLLACSQRSGVAEVYASGQLKWLLAPHLVRWIDDADGDGQSDSLLDGYDPDQMMSWVGDYRGAAYADERYPVNGEPVVDYSDFVFHYGEFLLMPLDAAGAPILNEDVRLGFADHDDFAWPFRPHAISLLDDGHVLLFDNGLGRSFGLPFSRDAYSRAVEYEVVEDPTDGYGGTVRQVWEFRVPADPSWHAMSVMAGDVDALPNGNRLVVSGSVGSSFLLDTPLEDYDGPHGALILEVDPQDNRVRHRLWLGRPEGIPITEFSVYRASRVDPYAYWADRVLGAE